MFELIKLVASCLGGQFARTCEKESVASLVSLLNTLNCLYAGKYATIFTASMTARDDFPP